VLLVGMGTAAVGLAGRPACCSASGVLVLMLLSPDGGCDGAVAGAAVSLPALGTQLPRSRRSFHAASGRPSEANGLCVALSRPEIDQLCCGVRKWVLVCVWTRLQLYLAHVYAVLEQKGLGSCRRHTQVPLCC
jgi:hypothetical protein